MAKSFPNAEIEEALGICASCVGSSGKFFNEKQCKGCPAHRILCSVVPPVVGKDHAIPVGLIDRTTRPEGSRIITQR